MTFVKEIVELGYQYLEHPWLILLVIPLAVVLFFLLKKDFVKMKEDPAVTKQKKRLQKIMFATRVIMGLLLLFALATPFVQTTKMIQGDTYIKLLVDNSTSMSLFEDFSNELAANLEKQLTTEVKQIGSGESSAIGDQVLNNLEAQDSILLVTDGNTNEGANLGDVALLATRLNSTINAINLNPIKKDAGIIVLGPSKTQDGVENTFTVVINAVGDYDSIPLKVTMDGEAVVDQAVTEPIYTFTKTLGPGYHKITAEIALDDYFKQNNVYYKTIKVVPKPKILFYSENPSPMKTLLDQLYITEGVSSLPADLSGYYALAVNNINADKLETATDVLSDFIADGSGLVIIGGDQSFESGGYKNSIFETLLPVFVSSPGKKEGEVSVVLLIDISGSTGASYGDGKAVDVEKALALGVYKDLSMKTRLSVIAFNTKTYLVSEPSYVFEKQGLEDKIARLTDGGGTFLSGGLLRCIQMLGEMQGSKNIIVISDGKTQSEASTLEAAKLAANQGIKIYTVGVGPVTNEKLMMQIAERANGVYFRANEHSKLKILFGDVEDREGQTNKMDLTVLNSNHFITENFEPNGSVYGFNAVIPKTTGRLLVTTTTGEPILTVWRLGLGRVAAFSTDDGSNWAGEMLNKANSRLVARTFNWAIGDPERKNAEFIEVSDTNVMEPTEVLVKSQSVPTAEGQVFYKIDENLYSTMIVPKDIGFQSILASTFAVNYPKEYELMGFNPELKGIVEGTGGKVFEKGDIDQIVEFTKTKAKRTISTRETYRWPFIILALSLLLIEIFIRRIVRKE